MTLWSTGRYDLRLSEKGFWRLTVRQFFAMWDRAEKAEQRADFRAGTIAAVIANANRGKDQAPFRSSDFFPSLADGGADSQAGGQTWEQQFAILDMAGRA